MILNVCMDIEKAKEEKKNYRHVWKQPKSCWIQSFKVLPFVFYHGNNKIHLWDQNHTLIEIEVQKDWRKIQIWQEYSFVTHLTLTQCLSESNLHWFQYSSYAICVLHQKTLENWKILVNPNTSQAAFSPWIWILIGIH